MSELTGKCLCEQIAYAIKGELGPIFNCHCSKCRRWHGAVFRTRASINTSQFSWIKGESLVARYQSGENVTKCFCSVCGSPLISEYKNRPDIYGVPLGGIEQNLNAQPVGHIFVKSKAPWYQIDDDLPQYDAWPGSEQRVRHTYIE